MSYEAVYPSQEIFDHIERIAQTNSKIEKAALVESGVKALPGFLQVLTTAYNPLVTYGVAATTLSQVQRQPLPMERQFTDQTFHLLTRLANRDLTGQAAIDSIQSEMDELDDRSAQLFVRILMKDMRAGFGDSTILKAVPGSLPTFPYMRCSLPSKSNMDKWDWSDGIYAQEKADGMFANVDHDHGGYVRVTTRQGSQFPLFAMNEFETVAQSLLKPGTQTHGELLVCGPDKKFLPREIGNGILNSILNGGALDADQEIVFVAWDQIPLTEVKRKGKYSVPYKMRFKELLTQLQGFCSQMFCIPTRLVKSKAEAWKYYGEVLRQGKEGLILKDPNAIWQDSTSKDQVKLKLEVPVELTVIDFNEGTGKYVGSLGSLICSSADGKLIVNVNGRTDEMRQLVWGNRDIWLNSIVTVKANSIMRPEKEGDPYSLFLPVFVELRTDKSEANTLAEIEEQFANAVNV